MRGGRRTPLTERRLALGSTSIALLQGRRSSWRTKFPAQTAATCPGSRSSCPCATMARVCRRTSSSKTARPHRRSRSSTVTRLRRRRRHYLPRRHHLPRRRSSNWLATAGLGLLWLYAATLATARPIQARRIARPSTPAQELARAASRTGNSAQTVARPQGTPRATCSSRMGPPTASFSRRAGDSLVSPSKVSRRVRASGSGCRAIPSVADDVAERKAAQRPGCSAAAARPLCSSA
mmetsp:Transcript_11275/g.33133  ORF Transcript_11275/g.33133 Transcript_11275/m.33133 type:complete len:236 (+) Transcript_11275:313-1020(+)